MKIASATLMFVLCGSVTQVAYAQSRPGGPFGPPEEAFAACEARQSGDRVIFSTPRGDTLEATCEERSGRLVAVPEGHHPGRGGQGGRMGAMQGGQYGEGGRTMRRTPPEEAFTACEGRTEGALVTVETPRGTLEATCRAVDGRLAALPARGPMQRQ